MRTRGKLLVWTGALFLAGTVLLTFYFLYPERDEKAGPKSRSVARAPLEQAASPAQAKAEGKPEYHYVTVGREWHRIDTDGKPFQCRTADTIEYWPDGGDFGVTVHSTVKDKHAHHSGVIRRYVLVRSASDKPATIRWWYGQPE